MDTITQEAFDNSPLANMQNAELLEMVYNSERKWIYQTQQGNVIQDCRNYKTQFEATCKFLLRNMNYYDHIRTLHPNIEDYEDCTRELAMEKVNN